MLVGIYSDTHLGFGKTEVHDESYDRFKECIRMLNEKKVDIIIHAGDLFDHAVPTQETWLRTFECFQENKGELTKITKDKFGEKTTVTVRGTPFVAIHGTHEFRGKDFVNALSILEQANCLAHLHAGKVIFEKNGEKIAIHGMGGVPEKNAKKVLEKYDPKPVEGMANIILFHQSFKEFLPFDDDMIATLSLSDLPEGFDLSINGHLHWRDEQNIDGKRFMLTGSTIFTQMKRLEAEKEKGVFTYDTNTKDLKFFAFKQQRKLFYHKLKFESATPIEVVQKVQDLINEDLNKEFSMKPLIRFKITGTLAKGFSQSDVKIQTSDEAIFSISKNLTADSFKKKMESFKDEQLKKKGVIELGVDILEKNVEEANIKLDTRRVFDLLSAGKLDTVEEIVTQ